MKALLFPLFVLGVQSMSSQAPDMEHTPFKIGVVNYFGYSGIDLAKIRSQVPLRPGDTITHATFSKAPTNAVVERLTGHQTTDLNITCCDDKRQLLIYIGLAGASSHPSSPNSPPDEAVRLEPAALDLYDQGTAALEHAVSSGDTGEDDSKGYMVSNDPALHKINLAMRAYATNRETEFIHVLERAAEPRQRQVAAELLGYVPRSSRQIDALAKASNDSDDNTRNNAVRALSVLSSARDAEPLHINPTPFIRLLFSGKWTDRNKASLFLSHLTDQRDSALLAALRKRALPPLIEGASWSEDPGHSIPFLVILGRIGGIKDDKLMQLIGAHDIQVIIHSAQDSGL